LGLRSGLWRGGLWCEARIRDAGGDESPSVWDLGLVQSEETDSCREKEDETDRRAAFSLIMIELEKYRKTVKRYHFQATVSPNSVSEIL